MANIHKDNYQLLIEKLDRFTRKYYMNKLIKGVLYSVGLVLVLFIAINVLEHNFFFSTGIRKTLFFSFIGVSALALFAWVAMPLLNYFRLGSIISHEQAAKIIGSHFGNIQDKLLNILQLKLQSYSAAEAELINASINQKTEDLKPVPFRSAIDLSQNKKYLRYALPPLMLLLVMLFAAPNLIKNSTTRLINNNKEFERPAPFQFSVENKDMTVVQFEDFDLKVKVAGEVLPNEAYIKFGEAQYKLTKESDNTFSYTFSKVQKDMKFSLTSNGFSSINYDLNVLMKPNIVGFEVDLNYPNYTGRKDETVSNIGDMVLPQGTTINWVFNSQNTDDIAIRFGNNGKIASADRIDETLFGIARKANRDENYMLYVSNEHLKNADSVGYSITVIPDLHPSISVEQFKDSLDDKMLYFVGDASDDYGLSKLSFNYSIENKNKKGTMQSMPMKMNGKKQTSYDYSWDLVNMNLQPGDKLTYYFEVLDNDGIHGSKSARTTVMTYAMPTVDEFEKMAEDNNEEIKDDLEKAIQESKEIQKNAKEMRDKFLQKKELDWQDKKEIENLLERQKNLEQQIEDAKKNFEENIENQSEFEETKEEILEKQEKLQELFEEVMSDEMKELMEKLEKLMEEMDRDAALDELENFEFTDEQVEKELDRMLELFKELEFEHEMQQEMEKLEELAKEQKELGEKTEKKEMGAEESKQKQEEINKEFDKIQEKLEELEEKNKELQTPKDMDGLQEKGEDIDKDQKKSMDQLQQQDQKSAGEKQKQSGEKMEEMAQQMQQMMQSAQMEQMQEDIEALRQLLENLVTLSFEQEALMKDVQTTTVNTPKYVGLVQSQYKLKDDFALIEDSLQALSKRVFQIESFVTEKVSDIKQDFKKGLEDLEERRKSGANVKQQRIMKGANDLALMLSEVMNQMQQQMANQMSGSQMCQSPKQQGQGKPMMQLGKMQQQLNEQMQQMMEGKGKPGKPGEKGKGGEGGSSKEFAEMAAKQAAIRKALKEMQQEKQQQGKGAGKGLQELIDQMDKNETELVNKRLTNEMKKRQEEILTKLLDAANAERQQEYEEKRESKTAKVRDRKMPPSLQEYIKKRQSEVEMYKSVSPALRPYYKTLVEEYFNSLKNQ